MQTTRLISALASAALLFGTAHASVAAAQTTPPMQATTGPMTTPTKAPTDMMTPAAAGSPGGMMHGTTPGVLGMLAIDASSLRARRTRSGYTLTGQALVNDACEDARFDPSLLTIYPPQFNLVQFRSPSKKNLLCAQRLTWVTAQRRTVMSMKPPAYITVRTQKRVIRVPIPY